MLGTSAKTVNACQRCPKTIADRATYEKPHQYAVGMKHVIVNGTLVLRDNKMTGALPGRVLRRVNSAR